MKLCVIEGDGIGHEVVPAAVRVLRQLVPELDVVQAQAGWDIFQATGEALPVETVRLAKESKAVLFGACSSPSYSVDGYSSPIVKLRRLLETHANLRPTRFFPVPTAREGVDLIVVRENTEDLYIGDERTADAGNTGTATKRITRSATERITHTAYQLARSEGRARVTIVHKGNVLPQTDGLFRRVAFEVSQAYDDIETDELLVDTAAYWMVKEPTRFDVVLTPNLYGDILSDMAAAWGRRSGFGARAKPGRRRRHCRAGAWLCARYRWSRHRQSNGGHPQRRNVGALSLEDARSRRPDRKRCLPDLERRRLYRRYSCRLRYWHRRSCRRHLQQIGVVGRDQSQPWQSSPMLSLKVLPTCRRTASWVLLEMPPPLVAKLPRKTLKESVSVPPFLIAPPLSPAKFPVN